MSMPDNNEQIVQELYNLKIHQIQIVGKNGQIYQIFPDASNLSYESLRISEGMFEASVIGSLRIRDLNSTAEQIHASLYDEVILKLENPQIPNSFKSLRFKIYNVKADGDQILNNRIREDVNITQTKLDIQFISYEHYLLTYKEFSELAGLTGADIITKIASAPQSTPIGLVNSINNKFFKTGKTNPDTTQKEMYIEPTQNWIWYKQNQSMYPWGKLNRPIKASQLMQYLAEYSVSSSNPYACNYLFWQDLDRWNFRSVESLLKEPVDRDYYASLTPTKIGNIYNLQVVQESNFLRLLESNALSGKYYLIEPKWEHPYREYLDYNESHTIEEVTFDYFKDYNKWLKVEKYPLVDTDIDTKPTVSNVINDNISGYFEPTYNNRNKVVDWDHHGYTLSNRDGQITWQPMFDQVDLDGEICLKIQKEIKQKIKDKRIEYANKKNLKEKWKVYKYSICCDTRSVELENEDIIFTPEYGIAAVGAFTDLVNYDKYDEFTGERSLPIGFTLSYDFNKEPFNKTIGQLMYLREVPDIQTKYLYDLELKKIELARERIQKSIQYIQNVKSVAETFPICDEDALVYCDGSTVLNEYSQCFCSEEKKTNYLIEQFDEPIRNREEILNSNYFQNMADIILQEQENFERVYEEYKNRKAFFISNEIGLTAENSSKNLFNVKSIKRLPIRGSKYEKLANKKVIEELYKGICGPYNFKGFSAGITSYYPYEIFYNNDSTIDPNIKHPYYDSGYNFDIGYGANPYFSQFDEIGGPNSGSPLSNNPYNLFVYYTSVKINKTVKITINEPIFGELPNVCEDSTIYTKQTETSVSTNELFKNINPEKLTIQNILSSLAKQYSVTNPYSSYDGVLPPEIVLTETGGTITFKANAQCDLQYKTIHEFNFQVETVYSDNKNNEYLSQYGSGICVLRPFGLERIQDFNPIDYLNSRNFIDLTEPDEGEAPKRPIENILEEIESYVRVEFERPLGENTLYDFPKGFYDTPGSEYFLPYHVFITAGPFGTKSVDYNISVIGQDPYGFDVAVKRIKKKKQKLKENRKALVNDKDYHIVQKGYVRPYGPSYYYLDFSRNRPISYGYSPEIQWYTVPFDNLETTLIWNPTANYYYNNGYESASTKSSDTTRIESDKVGNYNILEDNYNNIGNLNEVFYYDIIQRATRKNPLSLPNSYFEINNIRLNGTVIPKDYSNTSFVDKPFDATEPEKYNTITQYSIDNDLESLLLPGNVFGYFQSKGNNNNPIPIDTNYFKSYISYDPTLSFKTDKWLSLFEVNLVNRNQREGNEPENEHTFYGSYYGSAIWTHPKIQEGDLSVVWKNDITGETEYGIIGPELDEEDSVFDRNFAAQFMVLSRQNIEIDPGGGYRCANPNPVDNSGCPDEDPLCNCPCQELRPDKLSVGITGSEPTYRELRELEKEIKECELVEQVLGEEWLGCDWSNANSSLNCSCPCIGEKYLEYLKYSQTYCTFWQTPKERPLLRNAQLMQLLSNKLIIKLNGDLTLRPGMKININLGNKRYSGIWLVSSISHDMAKTKHFMDVVLIRDSEHLNPEVRADKLKLNTQ